MSSIKTIRWWHIAVTTLTVASLAIAVQAVGSAPNSFISPGSITLDGVLDDWSPEYKVVDEVDQDDVTPQLWCLNGTNWDVINTVDDCVNSYVYNDEGQLDIQLAYFGTDATNMWLGFKSAWPMMSVLNRATGEFVHLFDLMQSEGIMTIPQEFSHSMVFAFDEDPELGKEDYDWYYVAEMNLPADLSSFFGEENGPPPDQGPAAEEENSGMTLKIFGESNGEFGFQGGDTNGDTFLGEIDTSLSETNDFMNGEGIISPVIEIRQDIGIFFELTGLEFDEEVQFRLETHSDIADVSEPVLVTFSEVADTLSAPENLEIKALKKRSATLKWDAVTGATYYKAQLNKKNGKKLKTFKNVKKTRVKLDKAHLNKGRIYKARVRACDTSACSDWSDYVQFTTKGTK